MHLGIIKITTNNTQSRCSLTSCKKKHVDNERGFEQLASEQRLCVVNAVPCEIMHVMEITADYRNAFTDKMRIRYRMRYIVQPYNRTAQPRCFHNTFYGRPFREPRRGGHSNWQSGASESATKYVLLLVWVFAIDCSNAEFCASCVCAHVCEREIERQGHITSAIIIAACVQKHHHCVCHATVLLLGLNWW